MTNADPCEASQRYFAFIRAINVGGRRLTNEELIAPFLQLGFNHVAAYQAAGNITFCSDDPNGVSAERLQPTMAKAYGFDTTVFVRSHGELTAINETEPFSDEELAATAGRIQVSFLHTTPDEAAITEALALAPAGERVVFSGREWFWLPVGGISDSQLPVGRIEALVGPMTMRTRGTIGRMLDKFS